MDPFSFKTFLLFVCLIGCGSAQDILPEGPVDAVLSRDIVLTTLLTKPDYTAIFWSFNDGIEVTNVATMSAAGLKLKPAYEGRVTLNATNGFLTLKSLTSKDSGEYTINILFNDGNTRTAEIELRVLKPVSGVIIKSNMPEAVEHNSTVILTCSAQGSFLNFIWTNGSTLIVADGKRLTVKDEEMTSTLTIAGVLRSDLIGPIFCTAANNLEKEKSPAFNLTVHYGPDNVIISPASTPQFIRAGSNFSLACSALSSPPATFSWFQNQKAMEVLGPVLSLGAIEKLGSVTKVEDFTCRAQNAKTLRNVPSPAVSFAVMDAISGTKITGPTVTLIAGNSTANLSCQAMAGTVKTTTWLKDGKPLSTSSHLVFAANMRSVIINPLQKGDRGQYTCQLSNPVNTDQASFKMEVNFGPETAMVEGKEAVEVNEPITLTCSAESYPTANFTWKFNGTVTDVKTDKYIIMEAKYKNTGTYTCEAHNTVTGKTATGSHKLSVKEEGALDEGLSDGAIAGIIIAVLVALAAAIGLIIYCRQKVPVESPY
ncbi:carcinoembryonic antigen-related cell adhesion molecule 2 [Hippoglossus stenolepis]|uniref:carcinoembryonic antigen-related cell adhesion molecule 2 n=1 Tax=Hippoglossus stenolepis TaxID=195615 RepID=UPI001FAF409E|nr:carcinoembryonic antigen-related cell adhesion molecule 2 [Hippoglossus stenolepis]